MVCKYYGFTLLYYCQSKQFYPGLSQTLNEWLFY